MSFLTHFCLHVTCFPSHLNINPFSTNVPFLLPLKTSENLQFSDVFVGYRGEQLVGNGLINVLTSSVTQNGIKFFNSGINKQISHRLYSTVRSFLFSALRIPSVTLAYQLFSWILSILTIIVLDLNDYAF